MGAVQRRRTPQAKHVAHRFGDFNFTLLADFLQDQVHGEQRRQIVRAYRLQGTRVQNRRGGLGQIGLDVVPEARHLVFVQQVLGLLAHEGSLSK
jgi:hypothetical protein